MFKRTRRLLVGLLTILLFGIGIAARAEVNALFLLTPTISPSLTPTPTRTPTATPTPTASPTPTPLPRATPPPAPRATPSPVSTAAADCPACPTCPCPVAGVDCPVCPPAPIFHIDADGAWDLARLPFAGETQEPVYNLTRRQGRDLAPSLSPHGGQWIAFQSDRHGQWDIYTMDLYGRYQTRQTAHSADDVAPAWSPACTVVGETCVTGTLAFQSDREGNWDLFRLDVGAGGPPAQITSDAGNDVNPVWRPDASALAFQSDRRGNWDLFMINPDGTDERQLSNDPADEIEPAWSPDGRAIAYVSNRRGDWDLYVNYLSGGLPFYLTRDDGDNRRPVWSPNGQWIAFQSDRNGQWDIYAYGIYARVLRQLTDDPAADEAPTWNCDGSRVIFHSDRSGDAKLYAVALNDPRDVVRLTGRESDERMIVERFPLWQPSTVAGGLGLADALPVQDRPVPPTSTPAEMGTLATPPPSAALQTVTPVTHASAPLASPSTRPAECPACPDCPCPAVDVDCPACPPAPIFHTDADGAWDLARLPFAGETQAPVYNLTRRQGRDIAPSFSPHGGRWIAFQSDRDGQWDIYTMDLYGRYQTRQTAHPADDVAPVWSPACTIVGEACVSARLVFQSNREGNWDLFRLDVGAGRPPVRLTSDAGDDANGFWKPDGSALAFQSNRAGNWDIFTIRSNGSDERRRTAGPADDVDPAWSPNGLAIVYLSNLHGNWDVYLLNPNSDEAQPVTQGAGDNMSPAWSPDGRWIAFQSNRSGDWDIYAYDAVSGDLHRLTDHPAVDQAPTWNCDGSRVFFHSKREGYDNIYAVSVDEPDDVVQLTDRESQERAPLWRPSSESGSRALAPELDREFEYESPPPTETATPKKTETPQPTATRTPARPTATQASPPPADAPPPFSCSDLLITLSLLIVAVFAVWFMSTRRRAQGQAGE